MEPILDDSNKKMAPVVIWSNGSVSASNSSVDVMVRNAANTTKSRSVYAGILTSSVGLENPKITYDGVRFLNGKDKVVKMNSDDSICSSGTSLDGHQKKTKAPDGGWGWVVVFSSFLISMIADGISFSFGLLYIEFLNYFQESKSRTSWIGSLFMSVPLLSGPVMSALVDRYGCRNMTILGGFIAGLGFVVASFGNSIEWELIFFGVLAGIGLGLCYVTAIVSIAYWFDKYRNLAVGLGSCGTGVGTFVYAPLTQYFIAEYGWRGTVLLLAGTFLNMCVCGALMRDPTWWVSEQNKQTSLKSSKKNSSCGSTSGADGDSLLFNKKEIKSLLKKGQSPEYILTKIENSINSGKNGEEESGTPGARSVVNLPTFIKQNEKVPLEVLEKLSSHKTLFNVILENYSSLLHCRSLSDEGKLSQLPVEGKPVPVTMSMKLERSKKLGTPTSNYGEINSVEESFDELFEKDAGSGLTIKTSPKKRRLSLKDSGQHCLRNIRLHRNSIMYRGAMLNIPSYRLRASSCPDILRNSMTTIAKENEEKWYANACELLKTIFDFSMFVEWHFLLMSLATILLYTWFIVPYFYLAEHLTRFGYNEVEASFTLSIIGVANCIGMIGLGWAGDQPWVNITKTYAACLVLCGLSCMLMPLITEIYNLLAAVSALFGLFFASNYSFTPSILVKLIPLEKFTTAYGLILLCQGIGNLVGPPLSGWIFDVTGEWDLSFYLAGAWIMFSGILIILIHYTENRKIWGSGMLEMDKISNA